MEVLLQKDYAVIHYHAAKELICLHLIRKVEFKGYKSIFTELIRLLVEKEGKKLIIDQRYVESSNIEERAWLVSRWFPLLKKKISNGLRLGLISSQDLFAKVGTEYLLQAFQSQSNFQIKVFPSMDEALVWIENEKVTGNDQSH